MDVTVPHLRGLRERVSFDASDVKPSYLATTDAGVYIRLSPTAWQLLVWMEDGLSASDIAARINRQPGRSVSTAVVETSCAQLAKRLTEIAQSAPRSATNGFLVHWRILPSTVVRRIARGLVGLFNTPLASIALVAIGLAAYRAHSYAIVSDEVRVALPTAIMIVLLSLLAHEIGHATACARFGGAPNAIGAGIYMVYPALYSDVTDAWRLTRWQRVIVDIGGVYFQSIFAVGLVLLFEFTQWFPIRPALLLIWGTIVFALNPFFKFDGYWIISDALGVANLDDQRRTILRYVGNRLLGRPSGALPWPAHISVGVALCGALTVWLWTKFVLHLGPMLWRAVISYRVALVDLGHTLLGSTRLTLRDFGAFLFKTYLFICAARMAWRIGSRAYRSVRSHIHSRDARRSGQMAPDPRTLDTSAS